MKRTLLEEYHEQFRELAAEFNAREIAPHYAAWDAAHMMPRSMWRAAGDASIRGIQAGADAQQDQRRRQFEADWQRSQRAY